MRALALVGAVSMGSLVLACGTGSPSATKNVFGTDNRQPITSTQSPWSNIGRLSNGCTGTLIDNRLVLTAAHCLFKTDGSWTADSFTFSPNLVDGRAEVSAVVQQVWYGSKTPYADTPSVGLDWAVLLLDKDLGSRFGWSVVKSYDPAPGDTISLAGYSADRNGGQTGTVHMNCNVKSRNSASGAFHHDCDLTRGASGGPIYATFGNSGMQIVGVQSGEFRSGGETSLTLGAYEERYANTAVPSTTFFTKLLELVNTY